MNGDYFQPMKPTCACVVVVVVTVFVVVPRELLVEVFVVVCFFSFAGVLAEL